MIAVLPIYYQIKQTIKSSIINKEYDPGEKIPSENELAEKFKVSRLTVRQAISQLVQEGFLNSRRGEGTFLTKNETLINSLGCEFSGFMDDLLYKFSAIKTESAAISKIALPKLIREKLELSREDKEVVQIKRVRLLRGKLFTYTVNYLPLEIGMKIKEKDLYEKPLLQILVQDLGIQFTEAIQTIEASFAEIEVANHLSIPSGSPILYVERTMYTRKHKPIELYQSSIRGDLYKFMVRFKNVKRKDGSKWIHRTDEEIG